MPLYNKIGLEISNTSLIPRNKTVILEELSAFYYLQAFANLLNKKLEINMIPATGADNIPIMANMMIGLGIEFVVVIDNDAKGKKIARKLMLEHTVDEKNIITLQDGCNGIEDMFCAEDFRLFCKHETPMGENENPSVYCNRIHISKPFLAIDFKLAVAKAEITMKQLQEPTRKKIERLICGIESTLGLAK